MLKIKRDMMIITFNLNQVLSLALLQAHFVIIIFIMLLFAGDGFCSSEALSFATSPRLWSGACAGCSSSPSSRGCVAVEHHSRSPREQTYAAPGKPRRRRLHSRQQAAMVRSTLSTSLEPLPPLHLPMLFQSCDTTFLPLFLFSCAFAPNNF